MVTRLTRYCIWTAMMVIVVTVGFIDEERESDDDEGLTKPTRAHTRAGGRQVYRGGGGDVRARAATHDAAAVVRHLRTNWAGRLPNKARKRATLRGDCGRSRGASGKRTAVAGSRGGVDSKNAIKIKRGAFWRADGGQNFQEACGRRAGAGLRRQPLRRPDARRPPRG
jgi:hypothetical protein